MAATVEPPKISLPLAAGPSENLGGSLDYQRFMDCVHCGLCLSSCPTYLETGNENDSPRGRIYLWRAVVDSRAELGPEVRRHLDLCLECRACETACPSGVQYGKIIGSFKQAMAKQGAATPTLNAIQRWMLFHLTPSRRRMRWALAPLRLMHRLRLRRLVDQAARLILPRSLRRMQEIVPRLRPHYGRLPEILPAVGPQRARVALLVGCAADAFYPQATLATVRVLQQNGCEVWLPRRQGCCGALHYHAGFLETAQALAAANCDVLAPRLAELDAVINNAGGCGPVLKEYSHLLAGTAHAEVASKVGAKVRDIHEFLMELGPLAPTNPLPLRAVYHDACGLSHAQKIRQAPRQLLQMIPGLELVPLAESDHCCGAAGSYNLTQPDMAFAIGARKARHILATGARAIFTGNVGCSLQIARHLRSERPDIWVAHPMEALWAAYSGEVPPEIRGRR
jgi:glycolate oxidase iron-sulfur subunit